MPLDFILNKEIDYYKSVTDKHNDVRKIDMGLKTISHNISYKHFSYGIREVGAENEYREIYIDGSRMNNKTGCSIVIYVNDVEIENKVYRLNNESSVYIAEITAINCAIEYILLNFGNLEISIILDSRPSLERIVSLSENRLFICNIRNKILLYGKIKLFWIRAHKGNRGKERADFLAKEASCKINIHVGYHLRGHYIKKKLEEKYLQFWNQRWQGTEKGRSMWSYIKDINSNRIYFDR